jgi:hypothetical protein
MRSVLKLILAGGALLATAWTPGGERFAAAWLAPPWALGATLLQNSRKTKAAESKIVKAINGQLLSIRSRIATVAPAATITVAHTEFAANQKRQAVTKLDENERDEPLNIRLCSALGKKPLKFPSPLIVAFVLLNEIGFSPYATTKSSVVSEASRFAPLYPALSALKKQSGTLRLHRAPISTDLLRESG